jgi:hypothetical protein
MSKAACRLIAPPRLCAWAAPPWDFGRLLGVYVTLCFVVAQIINLVVFGIRPMLPLLVGGALIVAGGLTITTWQS